MFGKRNLAMLASCALLFVACSSDASGPDAGPEPSAPDSAPEVAGGVIAVIDNSFDPSEVFGGDAGDEITLKIINDGNNPHTFTIESLDVDTGTLDPGSSATITLTVPDEPVQFFCRIHGAQTMSGELGPG